MVMHRCESLFAPLTIGTLEMKNRIAMAPMATDFAEGDGTVSDRLVDYYEARARGGAGLIILEVCSVDGTFPYIPRTLGLWDDAFIPGLRRLVDAVHAHGARVIPQVAHPGPESLSPLFNGTQTIGPVAGIVNGLTRMRCRELGGDEIPGVVAQFAHAARRAREAGFDGIELHAAHAYMLLGSFLSALRNRRTDGYGGDLMGRCRFPLEVLRAIREAAGEDFPVTMRISADEPVPGGRGIIETEYLASLFARAGVAAFHVSGGVYPDLAWRVIPPTGTPHCINAEGAGRIRRAAGVPVMVVGRILDPPLAARLIEGGDADIAVLGRALLADPDWPAKAESGAWEDIAPCVGCGLGCVRNREMGGDMTCIVNPAVGREREMAIRPALKKKTVMVAGGGPAGLECARVAALAGHRVTLYERDTKPGGQFNLAAAAPGKQELGRVIKYLARQAEKAGVLLRMGEAVTPGLVESERPDAL
ncbi:MAG: FAD-dependent oxidoreductase, partial [Spirochaetes bacterium]|nr:FAD-dependent oxidoreductase [Spirochaetota bacterium]